MKRFIPLAATIVCAALAVAAAALAQTYPPPQVSMLNDADLIQDLPNGAIGVGNYYATAQKFAGYVGGQPWKSNALIGGDATTNLFQRATTGASQTTTVAYGGPDRWAYWSGASTAMTLSRDSTAGDLPTGAKYAFKMARTSGQTGVVQVCMLQEVESAQAYQFQGQNAELDFHAATGANFSGAGANMTAYIITGTGTDEGVAGSASVAFGLNAGGGGSGGWTGQANATAAVINLGGVSSLGRYAAVGKIPAGATEIAVALCWTPVGTAGTNDYIAFSNIALVRNPALTANATAGYSCDNQSNSQVNCSAFERRSQAIETILQQRYFYEIVEPAASKIVSQGGAYMTATICDVAIKLPVTMRVAPTITIGGTAESTSTWAVLSKTVTPVVLASTYLIQDAVIGNTIDTIALQATTASTTAGFACQLVGAGGGANIQASAEL